MANQRRNKPLNLKDFEEQDNQWESFIEILSSGLKLGVFCACIYIIKEIFMLANDMYSCVEYQTIDIIKLELIPAGILLLLAACAFWVMSRD